MSDFEDDIFVDMKPVQTYTLTTISADELARLHRIEEAARLVADEYGVQNATRALAALRAALEEKP